MWFFAIVRNLRSHSRTLFRFLDDFIRAIVMCLQTKSKRDRRILNFSDPDGVQIARYDRPITLSCSPVRRVYLFSWENKTIVLDISLHFRFVLCLHTALVNKGYRAISGRVEFNPPYRKPQTAGLHLAYCRVRIDTAVDLLRFVQNC